jgi:16S rRNA (guanine966-N2)-methyltransferase
MRIITGKYKGYNIKGDNIIGTRPTMNRIKESLLAMVQNKVKDATILDLFAGSGSLGLESLSNECKYAYFVDNNLRCIKAIDENISKLGVTNARVIYKDYMKAIDYFAGSDIKFDIIDYSTFV